MTGIDKTFFNSCFPARKRDAHKGDFGRILLFAGSCGMAGAAALAGRAALRSGAGLVRFLIPSYADPIYPILQTNVPEATCITPEQIGFYASSEEKDPVKALAEYAAIAAGSGRGKDPVRLSLLAFLIRNYKGPLVLDADALNAVAGNEAFADSVRASAADFIFTPHVGEAKRLLSGVQTDIRTAQHDQDIDAYNDQSKEKAILIH